MKKPLKRRFYRLVPLPHYLFTKSVAREMRRCPTQAEEVLWQRLRNRQLDGAKFRRQHPIAPYVVDFICFESKLIVELDGEYHEAGSMPAKDERRTRDLQKMGFRIIRFRNLEVLTGIDAVLAAIANQLRRDS